MKFHQKVKLERLLNALRFQEFGRKIIRLKLGELIEYSSLDRGGDLPTSQLNFRC